jgi:hypothetical protein
MRVSPINWISRQACIFAIALAGSGSSISATDLKETSKPLLSASTRNGDVRILVRTESAGQTPNEHTVSVISGFDIHIAGSSIHVPRSVYSDIVDPSEASIEFGGSLGVVTVNGGDGAEAYILKVFFDRTRVNKRTLYSALVPGNPTEETHYFLRVMKDE